METVCGVRVRVFTDYVDVSDARLGFGGVDLAHVAAAVRLLDVVDLQTPGVVLVVPDRDPRVARDDVVLHRQDDGRLQMDPGHLDNGRTTNGQFISMAAREITWTK